ncbi:MAG: isoaspartyl peptidase/L-asparaginase [Candidatus Sumerlaeota bacterium]
MDHTNNQNGKQRWAIALHGGAGTIPRDSSEHRIQQHISALTEALSIGRRVLQQGGTSIDAVEQVVRSMEDCPLFNAGRGAAFNREGVNELDAAIMDGRDLSTGAVAAIRYVKNPISLCRRIMEDGEHVLMAGAGAEAYARNASLELMDDSYFYTEMRYNQWQRELESTAGAVNRGTVGAVAVDVHGNVAAATSTGGLANKLPGRVGDSPIIGAGTFADNASCAISCTGSGEEFIRKTVASRIAMQMEMKGQPLDVAMKDVVMNRLSRDSGGVIGVDALGHAALHYNSEGMNRGVADSSGRFEVAIWEL